MVQLNLSNAEQELIKKDIMRKEAELNRKMYVLIISILSLIGERRFQ